MFRGLLKNFSRKIKTNAVRRFDGTAIIIKDMHNTHGMSKPNLINHFLVLKKCRNKFDCLIHEMLIIQDLKPTLNMQTDSIRAKIFT